MFRYYDGLLPLLKVDPFSRNYHLSKPEICPLSPGVFPATCGRGASRSERGEVPGAMRKRSRVRFFAGSHPTLRSIKPTLRQGSGQAQLRAGPFGPSILHTQGRLQATAGLTMTETAAVRLPTPSPPVFNFQYSIYNIQWTAARWSLTNFPPCAS